MTRTTSKASYFDLKESGAEMSQSDKILDICNGSDPLSLQEIMNAYRARYGNIELSSVSARVNKLKEEGKLTEHSPRKCSVTGKTINPVSANKCTHDRYRAKNYMMSENAMKAMKKGDIVWRGMIIKNCQDCGVDISHAKRVQVKTFEQWNGGNEK